jgi:hypothetical protein
VTRYDDLLAELADVIDALPRPSVVAFFWACSSALLTEFTDWATRTSAGTEPILSKALDAARSFALGAHTQAANQLLQDLERSTPPGESPDEFSTTFAQDCWICADVCIRIMVDPSYKAGPAVEHALEPVVTVVTEELFGVSQLGTQQPTRDSTDAIIAHPRVSTAIAFVQWAFEFLRARPAPRGDDLAQLHSRAAVLAP